MAKVKIVTDSVANLTAEEVEKYNIQVINLNVLVDGKFYAENEEYVKKENFYHLLKNAKELPKTSQPSLGTFLDVYDSFSEDEEVISIHIASSLSGTVNTAKQAAEMSKNNITVVDSEFADRGQAFQVIKAARLAQLGKSKKEILEAIEHVRKNTVLHICVFTLENLVKGGRVGKTQGLLANLLNIKVILEMPDSQLTLVHKGRGAKSVQKFLQEKVYSRIDKDDIDMIGLSYVEPTKFILEQENIIKTIAKTEDFVSSYTIPTVAIHAGQEAFAVIYCKK